jgi:hypothetical protein
VIWPASSVSPQIKIECLYRGDKRGPGVTFRADQRMNFYLAEPVGEGCPLSVNGLAACSRPLMFSSAEQSSARDDSSAKLFSRLIADHILRSVGNR